MIGVLLCVYNGEKYVEEQLVSLFNQKKLPDEVLIVDDCSSDNTVQVCEKFIKNNSLSGKWRLIINESNQGWRVSFFTNVELLKSDIIFFCDQDDIWDINKIDKMFNQILLNPSISLLACREKTLINDCKVKKEKSNIFCKNSILRYDKLTKKEIFHNLNGSCFCIQREFYNNVKQYWNSGWAHDKFFWRFAYIYDSLYIINEPLVIHRLTGSNASRPKLDKNQRLIHCDKGLKNLKDIDRVFSLNIDIPDLKKKKNIFNEFKRGIYIRKKFLSLGISSIYYGFLLILKYKFIYFKTSTFFGDVLSKLKK